MGQNILGVLYGCVVPADLTLRKQPGDVDDELLDKWEDVKSNRKLGLRVTKGDKLLVGFWIGIGGDDMRLIPDISGKCLPLTVIEKSKEAKKAIEAWKVFVAFARSNGVNLPMPTFWIAPLEIS